MLLQNAFRKHLFVSELRMQMANNANSSLLAPQTDQLKLVTHGDRERERRKM